MSTLDSMREAVTDALARSVSGETEMVTRWATVAEVMGADGSRAVYLVSNSDSKSWDILGLLEYGSQVERAALVADELRGGH